MSNQDNPNLGEQAFVRISEAHNAAIEELGAVPALIASIALGTYAASLVPPELKPYVTTQALELLQRLGVAEVLASGQAKGQA